MNIQKFTSYFHDGSIDRIIQCGKDLEIWMESSEILSSWGEVNIPLSVNKTILGKLIVSGIKQIIINSVPIDELKKEYDDCEILKFRICENEIDLLVIWSNYFPKEQTSKFEHIILNANRIEWE